MYLTGCHLTLNAIMRQLPTLQMVYYGQIPVLYSGIYGHDWVTQRHILEESCPQGMLVFTDIY